MRHRRRANGTEFLLAVLHEDLHLPAGSELHLRRLHDGRGSGPEHALQVVPPTAALTGRERDAAAADRLDGAALRGDPRDHVPRAGAYLTLTPP
jgi:hypothetical protein